MTDHLHASRVPGCYRCDLSQDEASSAARSLRPHPDGHPVVTAAVSDRQCDGCATPHCAEPFPGAGEGVHLCVDCRLAELAKMLAASGEKP